MGKGTIISGGTDGIYQVQKVIERDRITAAVDRLTVRITALTNKIAAMPDTDPNFYPSILQLEALQKKKDQLDDIDPDETSTVHCADFTENLSGSVGTIEIIGQDGTETGINIQPGYNSNAVYSATRDGQVQNPWANDPMGAVLNWAVLPGVQKWIPYYRYGSITKIYDNDTCDITLENIESRAQDKNINQTTTLSGVPIDYMDCSGSDPFVVGDDVLINFIDNDWEDPVVVGYKANPVECDTCDWEPFDGLVCDQKTWELVSLYATGGSDVGDCVATSHYTMSGTSLDINMVSGGSTPGDSDSFTMNWWDRSTPKDALITDKYFSFQIDPGWIMTPGTAPGNIYLVWINFWRTIGGTPLVWDIFGSWGAHGAIPQQAALHAGDKIKIDMSAYIPATFQIAAITIDSEAYVGGRVKWDIQCMDFTAA